MNVCLVADDFRIFCGDLGNEVNDDILARAFSRYPSFLKAKVRFCSAAAPPATTQEALVFDSHWFSSHMEYCKCCWE